MGATGPQGLACWDLDANGTCDVGAEDKNGSGTCTAQDCAGPAGSSSDGGGVTGDFIANGTTPQNADLAITGTASVGGRLTAQDWVRILTQNDPGYEVPKTLFLTRREGAITTPADLFKLDGAGGLSANGTFGAPYGRIPASGPGARMMWYPTKAAFRAGLAVAGEWDEPDAGMYSWAGGEGSAATASYSFAFGNGSEASGQAATALGSNVRTSGVAGFGAGANVRCAGLGCVAMGFGSTADGQGAVAIGYRASANGDYSVALGHRATAMGRSGTFVWGDQSTTDSIEAVANNEFAIRAAGGVRLRTNATLTTGCSLPAGSGTFACTSDRNEKRDFANVDAEGHLRRVAGLPIQTWRYKDEPGQVLHLGPTAQDFRNAFGLGTDDRSIGMFDIDGVNMLAIQALEKRTRELQEKTAEVDELREELEALKKAVREIAEKPRR